MWWLVFLHLFQYFIILSQQQTTIRGTLISVAYSSHQLYLRELFTQKDLGQRSCSRRAITVQSFFVGNHSQCKLQQINRILLYLWVKTLKIVFNLIKVGFPIPFKPFVVNQLLRIKIRQPVKMAISFLFIGSLKSNCHF